MVTPDFRIIAEGTDITEAIRQRLLSLNITDEAGFNSDKVEISLDDREHKIAMPRTGATLEVSIGYKESSIIHMGLYIVDEISVGSSPATMTLHAHAADMRQVMKAPRTKTWGKITIGDLVNSVAGEHGLVPRVAEELLSKEIQYLYQTEESDLNLLTRIASNHGAISKPVNGNLLFVPKGEAKAVSGKLIVPVTLARKQITSWQANFSERSKYGAVEGSWHDKETAQKEKIKFGDGEPVYTLRHTIDNKEELTRKVKSTYERLRRGTGTLSLILPGNTNLFAEGKLTVSGLRKGVDGLWNIIKVEHSLDNSGYICRVSAEIPKA